MFARRVFVAGLVVVASSSAGTATLAVSAVSRAEAEWSKPLPTRGALDGRELVASEVVGHTLGVGTQLNLSFDHGTFAASPGCNGFDGGYVLNGDRLKTMQVSGTLKLCGGGLEAQDSWLMKLIDGARVERLGDRVVLRSGGARVTFVPALDRDRPDAVVGKRWLLAGPAARGKDATGYRPLDAVRPQLVLDDRTASVLTPCVGFAATVRFESRAIVFERVGRPRPFYRRHQQRCVGTRARVDKAMRHVLQGRVTTRRVRNRLIVSGADARLYFRLPQPR